MMFLKLLGVAAEWIPFVLAFIDAQRRKKNQSKRERLIAIKQAALDIQREAEIQLAEELRGG